MRRLGGMLLVAVLFAQEEFAIADSLLYKGRYGQAIEYYQKLVGASGIPDTLKFRFYLKGIEAWAHLLKIREGMEWVSIAESLALRLGDTLGYAEVLGWKGTFYRLRRSFAESEKFFRQALQWMERKGAQKSIAYASLWRRFGVLAYDQNAWDEAERRYTQARKVLEEMQLTQHFLYASVLNSIALVYQARGRYAEAEKYLLQAKDLRAKVLGTDHPEYAAVLVHQGLLYQLQGRYSRAERLYLQARGVWAQTLGTTHPQYASLLNTLANLYYIQGRYLDAERIHLQAKEIRLRTLGENHPEYAQTLNNLANIYRVQGRYEEAEELYQQAKAIRARTVGQEHPDYALALSNLAVVYYEQGRFAEAEQTLLQARDLRAKLLGTDHPSYLSTLHNLASLYYAQDRLSEAEQLLLQVKEKEAQILGVNHPNYATTLGGLADIYMQQERYDEAEELLLQAEEIIAKALGKDHPTYYAYALYNLARFYQLRKAYSEADTLWHTIVMKIFSRIQREFPALPTTHRQNLLENVLQPILTAFQRYVALRGPTNPRMIALGYRAARSFKGVLLGSVEGMKHLVENSKDSLVLSLYEEWRKLADYYALLVVREDVRAADSVWREGQRMEKELVLRLPALKEYLPNLEEEPTFPSLQSNEAVVEVVRVPEEKKASVIYLFYLVLPGAKGHRLELFVSKVDSNWENQVRNAYEILRSPNSQVTGKCYDFLWSSVDSLLPREVKIVYIAPDGVFYQINTATLYNPRRKQFVGDCYEVRHILSSRRLLLRPVNLPTTAPVVIGNPDFCALPDTIYESRVRSHRTLDAAPAPLPGAETEAREVARLLGVKPVIGKNATETFIKSLHSPRL
ncbi:MAG: tetratricopeptide repeat protein, partial [Bacteroidia bacterium]|nr:tetratricopeptide repeat protein [Bacteroidia bacterium]